MLDGSLEEDEILLSAPTLWQPLRLHELLAESDLSELQDTRDWQDPSSEPFRVFATDLDSVELWRSRIIFAEAQIAQELEEQLEEVRPRPEVGRGQGCEVVDEDGSRHQLREVLVHDLPSAGLREHSAQQGVDIGGVEDLGEVVHLAQVQVELLESGG